MRFEYDRYRVWIRLPQRLAPSIALLHTYRLNDDGTLPNPDDCSGFDCIYKVNQRDLLEYDASGFATTDLMEWPWQLGVPVIDGDGDPNNYNLEGGDRPETPTPASRPRFNSAPTIPTLSIRRRRSGLVCRWQAP